MWNFELKFDANGGNGEPDTLTYGTNDTYTKSHTFTIPGTQPVRSGYNFKGWYEYENDKTNEVVTKIVVSLMERIQ